jgi:hypothetical protein
MAISFSCECGKFIKVRDEYAGKRAKCPACGKNTLIPEAVNAADRTEPIFAADHRGFFDATHGPYPHGLAAPKEAPTWPTISVFATGTQQEPWFYGFLEKYSIVVRWLGITLSGGLFLLVFLLYFGFSYMIFRLPSEILPIIPKFGYLAGGTFAFLLLILGIAVMILVPVLFAASLIQVVVDSGRNLRAIRAGLEAQGNRQP